MKSDRPYRTDRAACIQGRKTRKVTTASGAEYRYAYGENGRITEVENARHVTSVKNTYDRRFRIIHQQFPDGGMMEFAYDDKTDVSHSRSAMEVKSFMCMMNDTVTQRLFMRMGQKSIISIMKKPVYQHDRQAWQNDENGV